MKLKIFILALIAFPAISQVDYQSSKYKPVWYSSTYEKTHGTYALFDTSSIKLQWTTSGKPEMKFFGPTGNTLFYLDSTGTISTGTTSGGLLKADFDDSLNNAHTITGLWKFGANVAVTNGFAFRSRDNDSDTLNINVKGFSDTNTAATGRLAFQLKDGATHLFSIDTTGVPLAPNNIYYSAQDTGSAGTVRGLARIDGSGVVNLGNATNRTQIYAGSQGIILGGISSIPTTLQRTGTATDINKTYDSNQLKFNASYWNGASATAITPYIYVNGVSTTPLYYMKFKDAISGYMFDYKTIVHDTDSDTLINGPRGFSATNSTVAGPTALQLKDGATNLFSVDTLGNTSFAGDLTYGFIHFVGSADSVAVTPTVAQYLYTKLLPGIVAHEADGVTFAADSIKILTAGDYACFISVTLSGTNANDYWRIKVFKNNAALPNTGAGSVGRFVFRTTANNQTDTREYVWYFKDLAVNDVLSWRITNLSASRNPTVTDMKLYFHKIPE